MQRKIKRAFVTGGTKSDVAPIGVFAMNLKETNGHLFDKLIVFHDGISKKDQMLINKIVPTEFLFYKFPCKIKNDTVLNYFSTMLFCKYECLKLLEYYDEVIWSDYDVIIKDTLDEICGNREIGLNIVVNMKMKIRDMFFSEIRNKNICKYNLDKEPLNTPIFLVSKKIGDYMKYYDWCCNKTLEYQKDIYLAEQCIFSLMVQEFDIKYDSLSPDVYACHPSDYTKLTGGGVKILHAFGQPKFWNGLNNDEWNRLYKIWLKNGGSKYNGLKKKFLYYVMLLIARLKGIKARK